MITLKAVDAEIGGAKTRGANWKIKDAVKGNDDGDPDDGTTLSEKLVECGTG